MKIGNVEVYGIIYKITNKINGKVYIGQTTRGFNKRYNYKGKGIERVYHYYISQKEKNRFVNEYLLNSIKKYGFYNFETIEIYDIAFSKEELDIKEKHYIKLFDCVNNGYNFGEGGEISPMLGNCHSEEVRIKISNRMSGKNNPMYGIDRHGEKAPNYGKRWSEEIKMKISKTKIEQGLLKGENNPMYGKGELIEGKNNPSARSVICLTTKRIFFTVKEGAKYYNCIPSNISACCRKKYKSAGKLPDGTKLVWRYLTWNHNKIYRVKRDNNE